MDLVNTILDIYYCHNGDITSLNLNKKLNHLLKIHYYQNKRQKIIDCLTQLFDKYRDKYLRLLSDDLLNEIDTYYTWKQIFYMTIVNKKYRERYKEKWQELNKEWEQELTELAKNVDKADTFAKIENLVLKYA